MIELRNINKNFESKSVLSNFSYTFNEGSSYGIKGKSGSGKTTLLNIIGKLEKYTSGEVKIFGTPISDISERKYFRDYIGYLFQNYGLIDNESIEHNLQLAFIGGKVSRESRKSKIIDALKQVNLQVSPDRKIYSLSGGEAQRVAIAKLILKNPPIILADEPTASLDKENEKEVIDLILSLQDGSKIIIVATHNPTVWNKLDNVISMD